MKPQTNGKTLGCVPLGRSGSGSIQDRPGSWFIKRTDESNLGKNSLVLLMHHNLRDLGSLIRIKGSMPHQGRTPLIRIWRNGKPIIIWVQFCKFPVVLICCENASLFIPFPSGCRIYFKWFVQLPAKEGYMLRLFATFPDWTGVSSRSGNVRKQVSRSGRSATIVWPTTDPRKEMIEDRSIFSPFEETRSLFRSLYFSRAFVLQCERRENLLFYNHLTRSFKHSAVQPSAGCRVWFCFVDAAKITELRLRFLMGNWKEKWNDQGRIILNLYSEWLILTHACKTGVKSYSAFCIV